MDRVQLVEEIRAGVIGDREAVMLYGSCARGDDTASSDIDVLQLVDRWRRFVFDRAGFRLGIYN
jgi:predicted nucleotidyltransferase